MGNAFMAHGAVTEESLKDRTTPVLFYNDARHSLLHSFVPRIIPPLDEGDVSFESLHSKHNDFSVPAMDLFG